MAISVSKCQQSLYIILHIYIYIYIYIYMYVYMCVCALGSITTNKTSGGDGIPVELFKS